MAIGLDGIPVEYCCREGCEILTSIDSIVRNVGEEVDVSSWFTLPVSLNNVISRDIGDGVSRRSS